MIVGFRAYMLAHGVLILLMAGIAVHHWFG